MYELKKFAATGKDLHFDRPLSNLSVAFRPKNFIVDQIAPIVNVNKRSDLFRIWSKEDGLRVPETYRAPKTPIKRGYTEVSSEQYFAKNYAWGTDNSLEDLDNVDNDIDLVQNSIEFVTTGLWLGWEDRVSTKLTTAANVGSSVTLSGTDQWTDQTISDPIGDIFTGINAVFSTTGFEANKMVIGRKAFQDLQRHPAIIEAVFGDRGSNTLATAQAIATWFGLEKIIVAKKIKNTADEGAAGIITGSYEEIWGNDVLIYHAPDRPALLTPSFMYSFRWT
ncbi:MAG TPA: hypothetical protein ENH82_19565, partial [bacterium]|nr:hypothetical protein [bacterium]